MQLAITATYKSACGRCSRFSEEGIFNRQTGQSFLDNILSRGGSEEPMALFERFRRKPELDAMLKSRSHG